MATMPSMPPAPTVPLTIDEAIAYLEAVRAARPSTLISRIILSAQRPEYLALADAVRERQPVTGPLPALASELFGLDDTAAHLLVTAARRAGYIHNRASRNRPAWYASDRGDD
jgi:hypothetical protein